MDVGPSPPGDLTVFDDLELTPTPDDAACAHCGKAIPRHTDAFRRGADWLCSMACVEASKPVPRRYDVNASCYALDGDGSDGAYDLHGRNLTADEVAERLRARLSGDWGICAGGGRPVPSRLEIHVAPAGRGDDLPL
jgi:hypothetical protein